MKTKFLLLWLEAPLQSWGVDSKFGRRDSIYFPTKSGVAGLLLCAMGARGEQKELLAQIASLKQTVISYAKIKKIREDNLEKKIDREPLLMDFHMVGAGYNEDDKWENLLIPKKSDGGKAVGGGTKITYRYYLQDAKFAVLVEVPVNLADSFVEALKNPVYDLYLGRKNCVPTEFIYQGIFENEEYAYKKIEEILQLKGCLVEDFRVIDGELSDKGNILTLNDVPVQFGEIKRYRDRRVTVIQR